MKPTAAAAAFVAQSHESKGSPYKRATQTKPAITGAFAEFVAGVFFRNLIIVVIILSAALMGFQTTDVAQRPSVAPVVFWLDWLITGIFVVELVCKLIVFRGKFFEDGWNIFDLIIVLISLLPATQGLKVVRTLRILRVLRLLSAIPSMRLVINGLLRAIPGMLSAIGLLLIVIYVFAVLGTQLFGDTCYPGYLDSDCTYFFGSLGESLFTLFQIMTLESWSHGIVRPIADVYPWSVGFFVLYVVITAFAALNLFIGVVVNAMDAANDSSDSKSEEKEPTMNDLHDQIVQLRTLIETKKARSRRPNNKSEK